MPGIIKGMEDLAVIIPSFNTRDITLGTLTSLLTSLCHADISYRVIVVDNASTDGSPDAIANLHNPRITLIRNQDNEGYAKANNKGLEAAKARYVLYLNSDVEVTDVSFDALLGYLDDNNDIGGLTVRVNRANGGQDMASHRGFPTVWRSFCYFSGLERIFGRIPLLNRVIGGYHLLHAFGNTVHDIDSPSGAFFLAKKAILDKLGGFDEDFFMYGEDLDLAYRMKELGYRIVYYPSYRVLHLKYKSGLDRGAHDRVRLSIRKHFFISMRIFYRKHYERKYPAWLNRLVLAAIGYKENHS